MGNKKFFAGILVMALVFTMAVSSCRDSALNGTWVSSDSGRDEWKFNNGIYVVSIFDSPMVRGTYTTSGGSITNTVTEVYGGNPTWVMLDKKWYTKAELKASSFGAALTDAALNELFTTHTGPYSVKGSTLTLTDSNKRRTYKKK